MDYLILNRHLTTTSASGTQRVFRRCLGYAPCHSMQMCELIAPGGASGLKPWVLAAVACLRSASMLQRISFGARCFMLRCGSQMFRGASTFNQNIGGWNTARILSMSEVCSLPSHAHGLICVLRVPGVDPGCPSLLHLRSRLACFALSCTSTLLHCTFCTGPSPRRASATVSAARSMLELAPPFRAGFALSVARQAWLHVLRCFRRIGAVSPHRRAVLASCMALPCCLGLSVGRCWTCKAALHFGARSAAAIGCAWLLS
jgi:hypothetical protein